MRVGLEPLFNQLIEKLKFTAAPMVCAAGRCGFLSRRYTAFG